MQEPGIQTHFLLSGLEVFSPEFRDGFGIRVETAHQFLGKTAHVLPTWSPGLCIRLLYPDPVPHPIPGYPPSMAPWLAVTGKEHPFGSVSWERPVLRDKPMIAMTSGSSFTDGISQDKLVCAVGTSNSQASNPTWLHSISPLLLLEGPWMAFL